jgi:hypothetical protein
MCCPCFVFITFSSHCTTAGDMSVCGRDHAQRGGHGLAQGLPPLLLMLVLLQAAVASPPAALRVALVVDAAALTAAPLLNETIAAAWYCDITHGQSLAPKRPSSMSDSVFMFFIAPHLTLSLLQAPSLWRRRPGAASRRHHIHPVSRISRELECMHALVERCAGAPNAGRGH